MGRLARILSLLRPYWGYLGQALLISMLMTLLALPGPYITKLLLDDAYPHRDFGLLHFLLGGGAVFALFLGLVQVLSGFFGRQVGLAIGLDLQSRLYHHVQGLDAAFFDGRETGEILSRFHDLEASVAGVIGIANSVILNGLQLLVFPAVLLWIHPTLAALSLVVLPFDALLALFAGHWGRQYARTIAERSAALSARTVESLASIRTIQSLCAETAFYRRLRERFEALVITQARAAALDGGVGFTAIAVRTAGALAYGWYGWSQVLAGRLTPGTFLAFSAYAGFLYGPVQQILTLWPQLQAVRVHIDRFLEIYDRPALVVSTPTALVPGRLRGDIRFDRVVFGYGDRRVLRGVSAVFPARRISALVGRSGVGKSTLAKLVPRFYDPQEGRVCVDGVDVRRYELAALRRQIGFALQGGCLFRATIRDNLTFGEDIPASAIEDATRLAGIHAQVADLPDGYDTVVGEGGAGLSAGQQQRLALARVLLRDTPILILDEPTSALDQETEGLVRSALRVACDGRTTILIAHRPETIAMADEVVELLDGGVGLRSAVGTAREQVERCRPALVA